MTEDPQVTRLVALSELSFVVCSKSVRPEWVKPLAAVHTGQGSLPAWAEACSLPLRVFGLSAVHAIGLNSWTDTQRAYLCPL